jgi:hypothetical protein
MAPSRTVLGCWSISTTNYKNGYIPTPTIVRLDSIASYYEPGYQQLQRITAQPAGTVEERNYWRISAPDRHVMMKLGDGPKGVWLDFVPSAKDSRMHGHAETGGLVAASRTICPA